MIRRVALTFALALACAPLAAGAQAPLGGISIGATVVATIRDLGLPQSVDSTDASNVFTFRTGTAYVDDDGIVRAARITSGTATIMLEGKLAAFAIGEYTTARADAQFANIQEFSNDTLRSYVLSRQRELALIFNITTHRLAQVYYGERGPLARLGILPGDDINKTVPFRAPKLRSSSIGGATGALATIVRLDIDVHGGVTKATIVVPSSDVGADAAIVKHLSDDRYLPAQLGGRPIGGIVYREVQH